jgi:class 3 adenylate cyclase
MERPTTRFAWNGDTALAYQVLGEGSPDLLYVAGWISNVELNWEHPTMVRFLRRLARGRRLIVMDPRGLGCSERGTPRDVPPLETMMDDLGVVLDEVGSERALVFTTNEMCFVGCMFAATYPDRTTGLILYEASANWEWSEETPWEWTAERFEQAQAEFRAGWGTREGVLALLGQGAPTMADDPDFTDWYYRYCLLSQAPGAVVAAARRYQHMDIRSILPSIHVPVLLLTRPDVVDPSWFPAARFIAERIPGARLTELPGRDSPLCLADQPPLHEAVDAFAADLDRERSEMERVLATVLFTDIVGSTDKASEIGDRAWRDLLERHHAHIRALLERYRGVEVDTAGDGFFATFDGPARAIRCARAIVDSVRALGIEVRAGLHTGECEKIDGKVGGIAVIIGARVGAAAAPSEVLVSQTVKDLVVGSGTGFDDRGERDLKGVPGSWRLYAVTG